VYIAKLGLLNFRNYQKALFCPGPGINFLVGANAQGKTNMLEAVMMVLTGRPLRSVVEGGLVRTGAAAGALKAQIERDGGFAVVEIRLTGERKTITVDGQVKTPGGLPGRGAVTVFSPLDLALVQGSPQERRRFIDQETAVASRSYAVMWQRYQRALWQKNNALAAGRGPAAEGRVWDEQLALYGARVMVRRNRWLACFAPVAREVYRNLAGNGQLTVELTRAFAAAASDDEEEVERGLAAALAAERPGPGPVTVGPHRDDLVLTLDGRSVRHASSQGEQRTVVLALRLAGHALRRRELGQNPILLLDDAFYELDAGRQERLLAALDDGSQVLATAHVQAGPGRIFRVAGGNILG